MKNAWSQARLRMQTVCAVGLISATASVPLLAAEREAVYQEAREQLQQGKAGDAYTLLASHEANWSGEDAYDYLLGVAALDSGDAGEAIFSLQRLVARRPAFSGARMELARAYYDIGDNELARIEFERILVDNPPEKVAVAASQYMDAIDNNARAYKSSLDFYFEQGFGYDSNAPAATDEALFLNLTLSANNLEQSSAFSQTALGAVWNRPISVTQSVMIAGRVDHRANPSTHFVDATNIDISAGWNYHNGNHGVSIMANSMFSGLDREHNKNVYGLMANYSYKISDAWSYSAFARSGQMRFEEKALETRDVDQTSFGMSITQSANNRQFNFTVASLSDDATEANSNFSNDGYNARVSNSWFTQSGKVFFLEANGGSVEYDDQFFGISREDDQWGVAGGVIIARFPAEAWNTTFKVSYSEKDSSVDLYDFDRVEAGLSVRRLF